MKTLSYIRRFLDTCFVFLVFKGNNVIFKNIKSTGVPYVMVAKGGKLIIGEKFAMNNGISGNPIGYYDKCTFFVNNGAKLIIGNNVGISQTALICHAGITIGNNVKLGGGVKVYDTDFHSLDAKIRASKKDSLNKMKAPIFIKDNAFVGAGSIVLKGVTIGENSIIGAGSLVSKNVPDNEIWGGNPAKFIKSI
ncbi:acyltransferase [Zunongwangia atlantica 22II14-10F7]